MDPRASTRLMVVAVVLVAWAVTSLGLQQRTWHVFDQSPASVDPPPVTASSSWSESSTPSTTGEAGGEDGVVLGPYFHVLPGMQETALEAMNAVLVSRSKE